MLKLGLSAVDGALLLLCRNNTMGGVRDHAVAPHPGLKVTCDLGRNGCLAWGP
jgi:hypothetical protein